MVDVIANVSQITPEWLTQALRTNGSIKSSVTDVNLGVIGAGVGLMAELARLEMTFASPEDMPSVIIAKIASYFTPEDRVHTGDSFNSGKRLFLTCTY